MGADMSVVCGAKRKPDPVEWPLFEEKMKAEGLSEAAIAAFKHNYYKLASGADLMIAENSIASVSALPSYADLTAEDPELLGKMLIVNPPWAFPVAWNVFRPLLDPKTRSVIGKVRVSCAVVDEGAARARDLDDEGGRGDDRLLGGEHAGGDDDLHRLGLGDGVRRARGDVDRDVEAVVAEDMQVVHHHQLVGRGEVEPQRRDEPLRVRTVLDTCMVRRGGQVSTRQGRQAAAKGALGRNVVLARSKIRARPRALQAAE